MNKKVAKTLSHSVLNQKIFSSYTADGFVSAQLMRPGRSAFTSSGWNQRTPEEYREAGSGYIAYCGIYRVDEENRTVTHIPPVALLPNLIDGWLIRSVTLSKDRLETAWRMLPPSRCFLQHRLEIPKNVLPSGKGVGDRDASNLLAILKVFTVKNFTLTFDGRSDDQRIIPRQLEPCSN